MTIAESTEKLRRCLDRDRRLLMRGPKNSWVGIFFVAIVAIGCAGVGKAVRKVTYPPDFTYLPRQEVESVMWQLAAKVRELDRTLRDADITEPTKQQRVLVLLEGMQRAATELDTAGGATNHPLLDRRLPRLDADIGAARIAVGGEPPNYELAGAVSGACIYCHVSRVPVSTSTEQR